jgi:fatty acid desaturase
MEPTKKQIVREKNARHAKIVAWTFGLVAVTAIAVTIALSWWVAGIIMLVITLLIFAYTQIFSKRSKF